MGINSINIIIGVTLLIVGNLLPQVAISSDLQEPQFRKGVNLSLPIHQQVKTHAEFSDPVLGDQAQIVEWAWSPQYAERFGLEPQPDGLANSGLWLVGVKIKRIQAYQNQWYQCSIIGLLDHSASIIRPSSDRFLPHSAVGLPKGKPVNPADVKKIYSGLTEQRNFAPGFQSWYKNPANSRQKRFPGYSNGFVRYLAYIHDFAPNLSYFEATVTSCSTFRNPDIFRNELRFPTRIDGKNDNDPKVGAVFEPSAITFDLPDSLIRKVIPYTQEASEWGVCLGNRLGRKGIFSIQTKKNKRFAGICEPKM